MKRVLTTALPVAGKPVKLSVSESDHLTRVLRLRDGDIVEALDGHGKAAQVTLRVKGGDPRIEYIETTADNLSTQGSEQRVPPIVLEMAILKGDAMEWVVEKSVELGVRTLVPLLTAHTVVQIKNKGPEAFQSRWQKIADQTLKQCGRLQRLEVSLPISLEELLVKSPSSGASPRLWFDEAGRSRLNYLETWSSAQSWSKFSSAHLLIGPEGGWSQGERELLSADDSEIHPLGLGPWVLRAETAALFAVSLVASHFRSA